MNEHSRTVVTKMADVRLWVENEDDVKNVGDLKIEGAMRDAGWTDSKSKRFEVILKVLKGMTSDVQNELYSLPLVRKVKLPGGGEVRVGIYGREQFSNWTIKRFEDYDDKFEERQRILNEIMSYNKKADKELEDKAIAHVAYRCMADSGTKRINQSGFVGIRGEHDGLVYLPDSNTLLILETKRDMSTKVLRAVSQIYRNVIYIRHLIYKSSKGESLSDKESQDYEAMFDGLDTGKISKNLIIIPVFAGWFFNKETRDEISTWIKDMEKYLTGSGEIGETLVSDIRKNSVFREFEKEDSNIKKLDLVKNGTLDIKVEKWLTIERFSKEDFHSEWHSNN